MGTCCSSEDTTSVGDRNTENRRLIAESGAERKNRKKNELPEDSTSKTPDGASSRTSIFEQLQDADNEALSPGGGDDKDAPSGGPGADDEINRDNTAASEVAPGEKIDRKAPVNAQPSYADAEAGINKNAPKIKDSKFSMLKFISTSPTLTDNLLFNLTTTVEELQDIFKNGSGKNRAEKVGKILTQLSEKQRKEVSDAFVGPGGEKLKTAIEDTFSGDTCNVLVELVRGSTMNDVHWIRRAITKINVNSALLSEILCTRTNEQLIEISREYLAQFGTTLEKSVNDALSKSGKSYANLMRQIITLTRKESPKVNDKEVRTDIKRLYTWLEETNNWEKNKTSILDIFAKRSWQHINAICNKYSTKSMHDLQTLLTKKFGSSSKTGDALQVIIQIARDRFGYFAEKLRKAMKGLGTDDGLLIRTLVSRSGIELKEILQTFSRDFGEGKTIVQWLKGDTTGAYQYIVLSICNLDTESLNKTEETEYTEHRRKTIMSNQNSIDTNNIDNKDNGDVDNMDAIDENKDGVLNDEDIENWDEYLATSPTIKRDSTFQPSSVADYLSVCLTSKDKKQKKKNKEIVIRVVTKLTNEQRQDLFIAYKNKYDRHLGEDIRTALGNKGKGKSLYAVLALLQTPAQNDAYSCRKAIKSGDWKLLSEILCTRTNNQIREIIEEYNNNTNDKKYFDLVNDVLRLCSKKSELKIIFESILGCKRPQRTETNYELVKQDVDKLNAKKGRFSSKDKDMVAKILAENSWAHINQVSEKFGTYSEKSFGVVLKDVFGSSNSYIAAEIIYLISTQRFSLWCRLLKESMSGMQTNQQLLIRVLITRSEIDLGEINNEFSRKAEWGGGKTLKQWICDATKGSFQHLLLRIANLEDGSNDNDDNKADSEASVETSMESNGNLLDMATDTGSNLPPRGMSDENNKDGLDGTSETDYRVKIISQQSVSAYNPQDNLDQPSFGGESTINTLQKDTPSEIQRAGGNNAPKEPEQVDIGDMGTFMLNKMTDKTVNKLWTHIDEDGSGLIESDEVLSLMTFTAVLYNAYKQRLSGVKAQKKLDKNKIKKHLQPLCTWIGATKMVGQNAKVGKADFRNLFGGWLQEYAQQNPQ